MDLGRLRLKTGRGTLLNLLNLHWLVLIVLIAINVSIATRLVMAWHTLHASRSSEAMERQTTVRELELRLLPLRGLPLKVETARNEANEFYHQRFPDAYSTIASSLGDLASKSNVRLTRVAYQQTPAIPGLANVLMDASLSGQYEPLMHFINGLERSKTFFLIDDLTFTGEQGGNVNLRLRLTTFLYGPDVENLTPPSQNGNSAQGEAY